MECLAQDGGRGRLQPGSHFSPCSHGSRSLSLIHPSLTTATRPAATGGSLSTFLPSPGLCQALTFSLSLGIPTPIKGVRGGTIVSFTEE